MFNADSDDSKFANEYEITESHASQLKPVRRPLYMDEFADGLGGIHMHAFPWWIGGYTQANVSPMDKGESWSVRKKVLMNVNTIGK